MCLCCGIQGEFVMSIHHFNSFNKHKYVDNEIKYLIVLVNSAEWRDGVTCKPYQIKKNKLK